MDDDWDLHAVVRGCTTATTTTTTSSSAFGFPIFHSIDDNSDEKIVGHQVLSLSDSDPFQVRSSIEELHELYKPFFFPKSKKPLPSSSSSSSSSFALKSSQKHPNHKLSVSSTTPRSKRRKNQLKKVCHVPAESLSSDVWAWRKYGQKPIKGSPYPRGYYRCSSSKGCLARKQVERDRSEPSMFIVTYTAEHNHAAPTHRNSLAGSTRQKLAAGDKPTSPPPPEEDEDLLVESQSQLQAKVENMEDLMDEEEEEEEFGLSDTTVLTDDFFEGLDELTRPPAPPSVAGDCFSDPFSTGFSLSAWVTNNAAATAAVAAAAGSVC